MIMDEETEMEVDTCEARVFQYQNRQDDETDDMDIDTCEARVFQYQNRQDDETDDMDIDTCEASIFKYQNQQPLCKYIPEEMWLEILSRLSIKPLVVCRAVCKTWKKIVWFLIKKKIKVPICGFIIEEQGDIEDMLLTYLCLKAKETISIPSNSSIDQCIIDSGYDTGNLFFDLGSLFKKLLNGSRSNVFLNFHGGLLLGLIDGTYEVHNVVTKEVFVVPMSPTIMMETMEFGAPIRMRYGAVIELPMKSTRVVHFIVVMFFPDHGWCEAYFSYLDAWYAIGESSDYKRGTPCNWITENPVILYQGRDLYLYLLTDKDYGVGLKIYGKTISARSYFSFPLPNFEHGDFESSRTRLWECDRSLCISYYNVGGLWLWKLHQSCGSTESVKNWEWVPQLVVSNNLQLSTLDLTKRNAQKYLAKAIATGHRVMPLTCHPDVAVIFILVNATIYAYNLANDTVEKICETKHYKNISGVYPFRPCFRSLYVATHRN